MLESEFNLNKLLMPSTYKAKEKVEKNNIRFAHYTSSDNALKILRSGNVWLRSSSLMNDFSEIAYGWQCLKNAYDGPLGKSLDLLLNEIESDLPNRLKKTMTEIYNRIWNETYLAAISEHGDIDGSTNEDKFGRLSMWRAYAPKDGVAFILNNKAFINPSHALQAYTVPVNYMTQREFNDEFSSIIDNIRINLSYIKEYFKFHFETALTGSFRFAIQSTKHPAFSEEREWRIIYSPYMVDTDITPIEIHRTRVFPSVESIKSIPQKIYKILLRDYPEEGFTGATATELIDRVLIGPTAHSYAIWDVIVEELKRLEVPVAEFKVITTGIPLRDI